MPSGQDPFGGIRQAGEVARRADDLAQAGADAGDGAGGAGKRGDPVQAAAATGPGPMAQMVMVKKNEKVRIERTMSSSRRCPLYFCLITARG